MFCVKRVPYLIIGTLYSSVSTVLSSAKAHKRASGSVKRFERMCLYLLVVLVCVCLCVGAADASWSRCSGPCCGVHG